MYELSVQREFCAAHAIVINGRREPVHGHNWRVTMTVAGESLDHNGLLCDFHVLERRLDEVLATMNNADLNTHDAFADVNPTAENVAAHIANTVQPDLPGEVKLVRVSVTEAPGCVATFIVNRNRA